MGIRAEPQRGGTGCVVVHVSEPADETLGTHQCPSSKLLGYWRRPLNADCRSLPIHLLLVLRILLRHLGRGKVRQRVAPDVMIEPAKIVLHDGAH